ncbi:MAG TPA: hypothetical protein PKA64_10725 [Myxococcota bacterium]|nr:hypothetical protein [Myxococcota bacterium]
MQLGTWDESLTYGSGEIKSVLLAHAIILGIALFRYVLAPWWRGER